MSPVKIKISLLFETRVMPILAMLLTLAWASVALMRQLNFDESLALRTGYLNLGGHESEPALMMPSVLLFGVLGWIFPDAGVLFPLLRLVVVTSLGFSYWYLLKQIPLSQTFRSYAVLLALIHGVSMTHALEFRYDWGLLLGWLILLALLIQFPKSPKPEHIGVLLGWIAAHHVKGLFFAICAFVFLSLALLLSKDLRNQRTDFIVRTVAGGIITIAGWLVLAWVCGVLPEIIHLYDTFLTIGARGTTTNFFARVSEILPYLKADMWWWICFGICSAFALFALIRRNSTIAYVYRWTMISLLFGSMLPFLFLLLHPHPWAYMLTPCALVGAVLIAVIKEITQIRMRYLWCGIVVLLSIQWWLSAPLPLVAYRMAFSSPMTTEVAVNRFLRQNADSMDTILDPSGVAYFLRAPSSHWYVDTLFRPSQHVADWFSARDQLALTTSTWALNSYRIGFLPSVVKDTIQIRYRHVGGPLWVLREDPRAVRLAKRFPNEQSRVKSYWFPP